MSWPSAALGEITLKIGSGSTPRGGSESYKSCGVPLIRSMNVHDGEFVDDGLAYLDDSQAAALKHVTLQAGDVLLNITGASVARVCRLPEQLAGSRVNQHVSIVRPDGNKLDTNFLAHLLRAPEAKRRLLHVAGAGATREAITKTQIEEFRIPLPPLSEQRRISAVLDKADALRQMRKRALNLLDGLTRSTFMEMFGDPVRNPRGWPIVSLGKVSTRVSKGESPGWQGFEYQASGIRFITSENVGWGKILRKDKFIPEAFNSKIERSELRANDLLINIVGASIGRATLVSRELLPANVNQAVAVVTLIPNQILPEFALQQILTPHTQQLLLGEVVEVARANISLTNIKNLKIILPALSTQKQFVEQSKTIAEQASLLRKSLELSELLFSALQDRSFSGQL